MHLARYAERVSLVVRGASLAESMSAYLQEAIDAADNVEVLLETEVVDGGGDGRLESLTLRKGESGATSTVPADALFVMIGARPATEWLPPRSSATSGATSSPGTTSHARPRAPGEPCRWAKPASGTSSRSATSATAR